MLYTVPIQIVQADPVLCSRAEPEDVIRPGPVEVDGAVTAPQHDRHTVDHVAPQVGGETYGHHEVVQAVQRGAMVSQ